MSRIDRIREKLSQDFAPSKLDVVDESHLHAGHAGARPEGETHFRVHIESAVFEDMNRVARQREIMRALKAEFDTGLHALAIRAETP